MSHLSPDVVEPIIEILAVVGCIGLISVIAVELSVRERAKRCKRK